jgi:hypothetical protein
MGRKRGFIMAKTVFDVLNDKLTEVKTSSEEFLYSGGAKDYAGYKEVCGVIRGLDAALREINDLSRNYTDDIDGSGVRGANPQTRWIPRSYCSTYYRRHI